MEVTKVGEINCIDCIFVYDSKNKNTTEFEMYNIITAGDDGIPCFLYIPNSYTTKHLMRKKKNIKK